MTTPTLSYRPTSGGLAVDLDRLIASRLLIQANSGGGKSWAVRQLLEETHGRVQHVVIDPEGEFYTLRERFDYVLAGKDGDLEATPKTAKLLCRRFLELGASAIIDLYALPLPQRREFVRIFLTEMVALPKALWHPTLVVLDEAHAFAPERGHGEAESLEAVIGLCSLGRKRAYCAVLATQRISKLHKDAAAELNNRLIGRTGLDVDVRRAGDELGFDKERRQTLPRLAAGEFYAFGPAIVPEVTLVRTGPVTTTHPEPGALAAPPAPPSSSVRALLERDLRDLSQRAEEEARTIADYERKVRELTAAVRRLERAGPTTPARVVEKTVVDQVATDRAVSKALAATEQRFAAFDRERVKGIGVAITALDRAATGITQAASGLRTLVDLPRPTVAATSANGKGNGHRATETAHAPPASRLGIAAPSAPRSRAPDRGQDARVARDEGGDALPVGERVVLTAAAQYDDGVTPDQLGILTGYKRSSRNTYAQRLSQRGYVEKDGERIRATPEGIAALGAAFEPLPTGDALREYWMDRLPEGERRVLDVAVEAYPEPVSGDAIDEATGYKRSSRNTYLQRLRARRLVETSREGARASDLLFDEAGR